MKVVSELADIEFQIGAVTRNRDELIIESAAESTLAARIIVTPADALAAIKRLLSSPSAWSFLLMLPFALLHSSQQSTTDQEWENRRRRVGLNKPW